MEIKDWNIEELCGYKPQTTFYTDFSIADAFGADAIKDTYERAFEDWKNNVVFLTELAMVMSWKSFEHMSNAAYCALYSDLYYKTNDYAYENLTGDDLQYYIRTTD